MNFISNLFKKIFGRKPEVKAEVKNITIQPKEKIKSPDIPVYHQHNNRKTTRARRVQYINTKSGEIRTIFHSY
jgi:hypothetical protein